MQGLFVAVVADPDFSLQEDGGPVQGGRADGLADPALVAVSRGGVDMAVARLQGGGHCLAGLRWRCLEDAEPEGRYLDAVVQCDGFHG